MQLLNREDELRSLERIFNSDKAELIMVYGRRRVGKTTLLVKFKETHKGVYLLSRETTPVDNLRRFSSVISTELSDSMLRANPLSSWDAFFEYLSQIKEKTVIILDEFPYLLKSSPELLSVFQSWWDSKLNQTMIKLVLMGSSISMMERLSEYKSPIYGRRTGQLKLSPFNYLDSSRFLEAYGPEDKALVYGILGGMPAYLLAFDQNLSVWENLREKYLSTTSILYMDPMFVLRDELDEPRRYFAIMEAISQGRNTLSEIGAMAGLDRGIATKYLGVLIELGLIKRLLPFGMKRNGRYFIEDNYFDFWFRFIYPNMDLIEAGRSEEVLTIIRRGINDHMGHIFEKIVREYVGRKLKRVAPLWFHEVEIDLMGEDENGKLFAGEVKWSVLSSKDAQRELEKLKQKVEQLKICEEVELGLFVRKLSGKSTLPVTEIEDLYSDDANPGDC